MIKKIIFLIKQKLNIVSLSYSREIINKNSGFLIKKILEETLEFIQSYNNYIKIKNCFNRYLIIKELSDLLYHLIVFLIYNNFSYFELKKELNRRVIESGFFEKKNR